MHVLVATRQTQGQRKDDFCWTVEGELVRLPGIQCDCPGCGCDRALAGLSSSRATTTVKVADRDDLTADGYCEAFRDALAREGWLRADDAESGAEYTAWAYEHLAIAARFPPGTVLELRGGQLRSRPAPKSPKARRGGAAV